MRGKSTLRPRRRALEELTNRVTAMIGREFGDVDAHFVLILEQGRIRTVTTSIEDDAYVRALLAAAYHDPHGPVTM